MIDLKRDIESLTGFMRKAPEHLRRMKKTGQPLILTIKGKAEYVIQEATAYQKLMRFADELESLEFLKRSLQEADEGKTVPMREAVERLGKK